MRLSIPFVLLLCATALGPVYPHPARAQDLSREDIAMQNQIAELRHDVDTLRDQVAAGNGGAQSQVPAPQAATAGAPGNDVLPALLDRVSQLEDRVRQLQGTADETRNTLQRQNADLTKQIGDLGFRVQTLEGGGAPAPSGGAPDAAAPPLSPPTHLLGGPAGPRNGAPAPGPPIATHLTLQAGYAALARRDYPTAEAAARQTLAVPRSPHTLDAQFLLAQSLTGQHNYQQAALAYDDTYSHAHRGPHAADALTGLAASLLAIGEKPAACATLDKLHTEFPSQHDPRVPGLRQRAACH